MTDCGDARQKYLFPKEMIVECSSKKCSLSCNNGAKAIPSVLKCFAAKNKWKPRPFQKVMCVGGSSESKPTSTATSGDAVVVELSGGQQADIIGNGFHGKNTMTDCGDMSKKGIKLTFGVDFECKPNGCDYSCHNPFEIPNIKRVNCIKKGKKKLLKPRKAEIKCSDPNA